VRLVWTIDTESRDVQVRSADSPDVRRFSGDEAVPGDPLLPGLSVPAERLFADPSWWSK
ncbi:MAG: hypothetical protein JNG89_01265, partial [Planctomycetaceae bacterium]|nr:hypothetical protein [Planctomycetaceae bacterium]